MWIDRWTGKTIGSALADAARRFGSKEGWVFENGAVTYEKLQETASLVARGFLDLGVRRGDMVAIWMAGYAEWAYLYYGLARIGTVMVPVNTRYKPGEVEYVLRKSRAKVLVLRAEGDRRNEHLAILRELCPELDEAEPGQLRSKRLPHLREVIVISDNGVPGCFSFQRLLEAGAEVPEEVLVQAEGEVESEDVGLIQFTSGTTAFPKGAILYHASMLRGAYYCSEALRLSEDDRFFSPQPFFHAGGSIQVMLSPVTVGCTMIVQAYFDAAEALRLMEEHRCTVVMGHQPHFIEYLNHTDLPKRQLSLRKGFIFASPDVNRRVYQEMGIKGLMSAYGLTETHLAGTSCHMDDTLEKRLSTVGRPVPGVELGVREPNGTGFLRRGETGEVCFRGWCTMKGYYDDPGRTAEVLDDEGWLRTGDLGVVDPDGYLRLVGRIKDMIRVGGENFAAAEVEAFLYKHDTVKQIVVVGMPDPRLGEVCAAFVELKPDAHATQEELIDYCRAGLASFKVPRRILFVQEWPMGGTGKIQRFLLRESLAKPEVQSAHSRVSTDVW